MDTFEQINCNILFVKSIPVVVRCHVDHMKISNVFLILFSSSSFKSVCFNCIYLKYMYKIDKCLEYCDDIIICIRWAEMKQILLDHWIIFFKKKLFFDLFYFDFFPIPILFLHPPTKKIIGNAWLKFIIH